MCTVTFMARPRGFVLGMNRDEKLSRPTGLPPKIVPQDGRKIIRPAEPGGGTWIAVNDARAAFALINWYTVKPAGRSQVVSRGVIVKAVSSATSPKIADKILARLPLNRIRPFRLVGFFAGEKKVVEWRWNTRSLSKIRHRWKTNIWISSGYDEPGAQRARCNIFSAALRQQTAGSVAWLRRLHRCHKPDCGPYSICMHRAEAATVSYVEVLVYSNQARMNYSAQYPCRNNRTSRTELSCEKFNRADAASM